MGLENLLISKFSWKRLMSSLILIPLFVYLGLGMIAYFLADKIIFQPPPAVPFEIDSALNLTAPNGEKISAKFFPNPNAEFTILFSHGNAEDIFGSTPFFEKLRDAGFNVFAYDYRGYGASEGVPSERNSYEDAEAAYNYLINELKIAPEKIIIHGRSLGAAVSIDLASRKKCGGLIVESAFVSAFRVLTRYPVFPFDKFKNLGKIKQVSCPALFIHGRNDEIIPFRHGEMLFAAANQPKFSLWLDAAGHNNVSSAGGQAYLKAIRDFADNLPK
jgi:abhydrolase domain-containing protein 17